MEIFSLKIFKGVPLHLNTYTCKYQTATYLMRFSWVDIGKGIDIRPTNGERNKFVCSLGVKPLIHQSELGTYTKVAPFQEKVPFTL